MHANILLNKMGVLRSMREECGEECQGIMYTSGSKSQINYRTINVEVEKGFRCGGSKQINKCGAQLMGMVDKW